MDTHALGACAERREGSTLSPPIMNKNQVRNFSIIAHIDHGKSALADRLIDISQGKSWVQQKNNFLILYLEKERGITTKAQAIRLGYNYNNEEYQLNLIDTPGHVDFNYEVSRSQLVKVHFFC